MPAVVRQKGGAASRGTAAHAHPLPVHKDAYRLGRAVATMMTVVGWVAFLFGGGVAIIAGIVQIGIVPAKTLGFLVFVLPYGVMTVISGFAMIFVGQFARASFDTANATRELVAIARSKSGALP
jgi:hypothetical protein